MYYDDSSRRATAGIDASRYDNTPPEPFLDFDPVGGWLPETEQGRAYAAGGSGLSPFPHAGHSAQQQFLRRFGAGDLPDEPALAHHQDARRQSQHLGHFR